MALSTLKRSNWSIVVIITNNSVYLHIHKTGGTWIRHVLKPITVEDRDHELLDKKAEHVFAFVRNPWAWYVCSYNALMYGSEDDPADSADPLIVALGKRPTFQEFLETQITPSPLFKKKLNLLFKINPTSNVFPRIAERWLETDASWYQNLCDVFTEHATDIGTTENLAEDLVRMLTAGNELTDELVHRIKTTPMKNVGKISVDYRSMYTVKQSKMVEDSTQPLIKQFGYKF